MAPHETQSLHRTLPILGQWSPSGIESPIEPSGCHNNQRLACTASDSERRRAHVDEPPGNERGTQNAYRTQSGLDVEGTFCLPVVGRKMSLDIPSPET